MSSIFRVDITIINVSARTFLPHTFMDGTGRMKGRTDRRTDERIQERTHALIQSHGGRIKNYH